MEQAVIKAALAEIENGRPAVLATLVRTLGSTPQKIGSQILIKADQSIVGTVGGGCVEGDVWFRAMDMLKSDEHFSVYEYTLNEDLAAEDGLTCGGTVKFMLESLTHPQTDIGAFLDAALGALTEGRQATTATVIRRAGDSGMRVADRIFITPSLFENRTWDGRDLTAAEMDALQAANAAVGERLNGCGCFNFVSADGEYEFFVCVHGAPTTVLVLGGGHVGAAVANLASAFLGLRVIVADDRAEFADRERFPQVEAAISGDYATVVRDLGVDAEWRIVIVTRGHRQDLNALTSALETPAEYIGLMGSKRKAILLLKELKKRGYAERQLRRIYTPVGLDIGAVSPQEIAVSIMAEILKLKARVKSAGDQHMRVAFA